MVTGRSRLACIYAGAVDPNSAPRVYPASAFPTEPSLQPKLTFFYLTPLSRNTNRYQRAETGYKLCAMSSPPLGTPTPSWPRGFKITILTWQHETVPQLEEFRMVVEVESPGFAS